VLPHVQSGKLRALAATGPKRSTAAPQLPTVAEAGVPGYEVTSWFAVLVPAGTPNEIVAKLNRDFVRVLQISEVKQSLAAQGAESVGSTPEQLTAFIRAELARWCKVIKAAGIKPE
jgi:tripartite-type tricarboxylate transporter receptor subunit TctC